MNFTYFLSFLITMLILIPLSASMQEFEGDISEEDLELLETYLDLGLGYFEEEEFETALNFYDKVLEINPDNIFALEGKAYSLEGLGRDEEARFYFEKLLQLTFSEGVIIDPVASEDVDEFDEFDLGFSEEDFELIEEYLENGVDHFQDDEFEMAIDFFDKVLEIDPLEIDALNGKALSLEHLGMNEDAILFYDEALEIDSSDVDALNGKGTALDNLGMHEDAILLYDKVLENEPSNIDALDGMTLSLESLGRDDEAIQYLEKIIELTSPDIDIEDLVEEEPLDPEDSKAAAEFDQTLFVIVGLFVVILIIIIVLDLIARKRSSLEVKTRSEKK